MHVQPHGLPAPATNTWTHGVCMDWQEIVAPEAIVAENIHAQIADTLCQCIRKELGLPR
ncbi:MAG: hypothetical protein L0H94_06860 [Nitrospira sp.]|nr:hypothetical protein [Nitrospira sp.]